MKTTIQTADQWWNTATGEIKALFSGAGDAPMSQEGYDDFWRDQHPCDRDNIFRFCQVKAGMVKMSEDDLHNLFKEIVCELADMALERQYGLSREEMCDEDGSYLEEYQDSFNNLYDAIETRFLNYEWE